MRDCIKRVMEVSGLDKEKAKEMLDTLKNEADKAVEYGQGLVDFDEAIKQIAGDRLYQTKVQTMQSLRAKVKNNEVRASFENVRPNGDNAITADIWGTYKNLENGKNSIALEVQSTVEKYQTNLTAELERAGLSDYVKNKTNDLNVAKEWNILTEGQEKPTGDANAVKAAKILHDMTEELRILQNNEGAFIGKLTGFMGAQYHNEARIKATPKADWISYTAETIDAQKMGLLSPEAVKTVLGEIYDDITAGRYAQRAANVAASVSKSREIHFKNAEAFVGYNQKFGMEGLLQNTAIRIEKSARNYAMMKRLGTRPDEELTRRIGFLESDWNKKRAANVWAEITGKTMQPSNATVATVGSAIRAFNTITMLGQAAISSLPDMANLVGRLQSNGVPVVQSWVKGVTAPFKAIKDDAVRKEIARRFAVGHRAAIGALLGSDVTLDNPNGIITKSLNTFFKLNLQNWWSEKAMQTMFVASTTNYHARIADRKFADLPSDLVTTFKQYGIDEADWDSIRAAGEKLDDGEVYINNEAISDKKTAQKYFMMIHDQTKMVTLDADARIRGMMNLGTQRGTLEGETLRFFWQFKSFGISSLRRGYMDYAARGQYGIMAQVAIGSFGMALVSQALKDIVKGKEPELDYTKAVATSGLGGIAADMTVNYMLNSYGKEYVGAIAGPTAGKINDLATAAAGGRNRIYGRSYIPGQNLYFAPTLEYLFINEAIDTFAPGYLNDVEKKMNKRGEPFVGPSLYRDMQ